MAENRTRTEKFWEGISAVRRFTSNILFLLIFLIFIFVFVGFLLQGGVEDPKGKALVINPSGPIVEQMEGIGGDPLSIILQGPPQKGVLLRNILKVLEAVQDDQRIDYVILKLDNIYGTGQTVLYDVGQALSNLKKSGKTIIAVGDNYDESAYYLASFSNEIILNPDGVVLFEGYSRFRTYYKDFLEKLKISINLFRVGKYKSAMEPYIRNDMSEEAKKANKAWMGELWQAWKVEVAKNRDLKPEDIQNFADNAHIFIKKEKGDIATALLKANLIDKLLNRTQTREYLMDKMGKSEDEKTL